MIESDSTIDDYTTSESQNLCDRISKCEKLHPPRTSWLTHGSATYLAAQTISATTETENQGLAEETLLGGGVIGDLGKAMCVFSVGLGAYAAFTGDMEAAHAYTTVGTSALASIQAAHETMHYGFATYIVDSHRTY
jgi:hypothetical protein